MRVSIDVVEFVDKVEAQNELFGEAVALLSSDKSPAICEFLTNIKENISLLCEIVIQQKRGEEFIIEKDDDKRSTYEKFALSTKNITS